MVATSVSEGNYNASQQDLKKTKYERPSPGQQQQQQQPQAAGKNDKYGSWGPIFKNKQHFVDMHFC